MAILAPMDVEIMGDRPWRSDSGGKKPSITLAPVGDDAVVEESENASTASSKADGVMDGMDEFDHVASLLAQESGF